MCFISCYSTCSNVPGEMIYWLGSIVPKHLRWCFLGKNKQQHDFEPKVKRFLLNFVRFCFCFFFFWKKFQDKILFSSPGSRHQFRIGCCKGWHTGNWYHRLGDVDSRCRIDILLSYMTPRHRLCNLQDRYTRDDLCRFYRIQACIQRWSHTDLGGTNPLHSKRHSLICFSLPLLILQIKQYFTFFEWSTANKRISRHVLWTRTNRSCSITNVTVGVDSTNSFARVYALVVDACLPVWRTVATRVTFGPAWEVRISVVILQEQQETRIYISVHGGCYWEAILSHLRTFANWTVVYYITMCPFTTDTFFTCRDALETLAELVTAAVRIGFAVVFATRERLAFVTRQTRACGYIVYNCTLGVLSAGTWITQLFYKSRRVNYKFWNSY